MFPISYKRHRFPPHTIRLALWLYFRFTTSLRDVEEMLAERGIDVTYEAVRCWANKFGPAIAANLRRRRPRADAVWHLDVPKASRAKWWSGSPANACTCGVPSTRKAKYSMFSFRSVGTRLR